MKTIHLYLIITACTLLKLDTQAQNNDFITFVNQHWEDRQLHQKIASRNNPYLFNSKQFADTIEADFTEIPLRGIKSVPQSRKKISSFTDRLQVLIAINESYFDM